MNSADPVWYVPGKQKKPVGPYTADQVLQALGVRQLLPETLCWREGMGEWLPLSNIEPFAGAIRGQSEEPKADPDRPDHQLPKRIAGKKRSKTMLTWIGAALVVSAIVAAMLIRPSGNHGGSNAYRYLPKGCYAVHIVNGESLRQHGNTLGRLSRSDIAWATVQDLTCQLTYGGLVSDIELLPPGKDPMTPGSRRVLGVLTTLRTSSISRWTVARGRTTSSPNYDRSVLVIELNRDITPPDLSTGGSAAEWRKETAGNHVLYVEGEEPYESAWCFPDRRTIVTGPADDLRAACHSAKPVAVPENMKKAWQSLDTSHTVVATTLYPRAVFGLQRPVTPFGTPRVSHPGWELVNRIERVVFQADFGGAINLSWEIVCDNEQTAEQIMQHGRTYFERQRSVKWGLSLFKKGRIEGKHMRDFLASVELTRSGRVVRTEASVRNLSDNTPLDLLLSGIGLPTTRSESSAPVPMEVEETGQEKRPGQAKGSVLRF